MIAADRRRQGAVPRLRERWRSSRAKVTIVRWTRRVDRVGNRGLERAHPPLRRGARGAAAGFDAAMAWLGARLAWVGRRLRRPASVGFHGLARLEARVRRACAAATRAATAASAVVTPLHASGAVIAAAGLALIVSQFLNLRGIEIGQAAYADLPAAASPPTVDVRTVGSAHAYLLVPVGVLGALIGAACMGRERRRWGLFAAGLGLLAIVVILAVDLPSGLDVGAQSSRFAGASAVLEDGFYAELAAAAGLVLAGLLYYARPCRIRISSSGRAASARRRRPRRRASSRARVARSA
jgi:hypothetical protein